MIKAFKNGFVLFKNNVYFCGQNIYCKRTMCTMEGQIAVNFIKDHINFVTRQNWSREELLEKKLKKQEVTRAFKSAKKHSVRGTF